jgi:hypothetical protein
MGVVHSPQGHNATASQTDAELPSSHAVNADNAPTALSMHARQISPSATPRVVLKQVSYVSDCARQVSTLDGGSDVTDGAGLGAGVAEIDGERVVRVEIGAGVSALEVFVAAGVGTGVSGTADEGMLVGEDVAGEPVGPNTGAAEGRNTGAATGFVVGVAVPGQARVQLVPVSNVGNRQE